MKKIDYFKPEVNVIRLNQKVALLAESNGDADIPVDDD